MKTMKLMSLFLMATLSIGVSSCGDDDDDEQKVQVYDPAGEIEHTWGNSSSTVPEAM